MSRTWHSVDGAWVLIHADRAVIGAAYWSERRQCWRWFSRTWGGGGGMANDATEAMSMVESFAD